MRPVFPESQRATGFGGERGVYDGHVHNVYVVGEREISIPCRNNTSDLEHRM